MTSIMPIFQPRRASWKTGKPSAAEGGQNGPGPMGGFEKY